MAHLDPPRLPRLAILLTSALMIAPLSAQVPGEVDNVGFDDLSTLSWSPATGADSYNVYRGVVAELAAGVPPRCHGFGIGLTSFTTPSLPEPGTGFAFLVTGESSSGEGPPGDDSQGVPRSLVGACAPVMRTHVLDRAGYGWNEWSRDRIESLGLEGYIAEQLDPRLIDESTNDELNNRLGAINPPADIVQLVQQQLIRAVYARRQLEQQMAAFWANHFNTDWSKITDLYNGAFPECQSPGDPPQCDPDYPARSYLEASLAQFRDMQSFRNQSFYGTFREMVEVSALSPAMIIYLDTYLSVAGSPNENFPRELMELYAMGVDGGYTQQDVEQLSRVITGWTLCKKLLADVDDPAAPCLPEYWEEEPPGRIVATFVPGSHDCGSKVLFEGTPQQVDFPNICANPELGVQELHTALDAIVSHPSTARFISRKILQRLVTDTPGESMIDALVSAWGPPSGGGDIPAVVQAALSPEILLDPDLARGKIKTPLEHFTSAIRATRGRTDGATQVINFLVTAQHIPHYNPVPTGWPEDGDSWVGTNNTLERQNFGFILQFISEPGFGAEPIDLLNANGVSTAPGNAEAIVDFLADVFYGGALTPAERQMAIDYLNTDDVGQPSDYDDARIREVVAVMLGFPHFQEQ